MIGAGTQTRCTSDHPGADLEDHSIKVRPNMSTNIFCVFHRVARPHVPEQDPDGDRGGGLDETDPGMQWQEQWTEKK